MLCTELWNSVGDSGNSCRAIERQSESATSDSPAEETNIAGNFRLLLAAAQARSAAVMATRVAMLVRRRTMGGRSDVSSSVPANPSLSATSLSGIHTPLPRTATDADDMAVSVMRPAQYHGRVVSTKTEIIIHRKGNRNIRLTIADDRAMK